MKNQNQKNKDIRSIRPIGIGNHALRKAEFIPVLLAVFIFLSGCVKPSVRIDEVIQTLQEIPESQEPLVDGIQSWNGEDEIPAYSGDPWTDVNGGIPYFNKGNKVTDAFEIYADFDDLGRCGQAYANICLELMPTEERGQIGQVKPSGWHTVKYPEQIKDLYLYNRCHLIGFQLAGENANEKNLVTGTRYLNIEGMLPFENEIAEHVHEMEHHVLYRVTPVFTGDDLVCRGVEMEAMCVEDDGKTNGFGVQFHVFAYNVQPGIGIDYATGDSWIDGNGAAASEPVNAQQAETDEEAMEYAININSKKFHLPECGSVGKANPENIKCRTCTREDLIEDGYSPCGTCEP